jgi:Major intrinsic protein
MNPARVIGPALVFLCTPQKTFWFYLLGEGIGAVLAGLWATGTFKVAAGDTPGDGSEILRDQQFLSGRLPKFVGRHDLSDRSNI